jgi:putative FmdB family regulatory protein
MPIYEYLCQKCSYKFEKLIRGKERPACPKCQGQKLTRLFSTFATSGPAGEEGACGENRTPYCPEGPCSPDSCPAGHGHDHE